ncbi:MAG: DUF2891 domain-containing protein [Bacteroidota bacterium]
MKPIVFSICMLCMASLSLAQSDDNPYLTQDDKRQLRLTAEGASHFARLALDCLQKEYPNKLNQVLQDSSMLRSPRELHPAFYGCFDWHSSVHGHWMLVRLLRLFPDLPEAAEIRKKLTENLTAANIAGELAYLEGASKSWERMYGWSWLLKLADELHDWEDADGKGWKKNLQPLADAFAARYLAFLPKQQYAVRTGVHPNTPFGLTFALDYARKSGKQELERVIVQQARQYFENDQDCPASWEPSGEDFLSPCLEEANLMSRILSKDDFNVWFHQFLPKKQLMTLREPAGVTDRSDPKIVHLDGVNLSRAWCLYQLAPKVKSIQIRSMMQKAAGQHLQATVPYIASEYYEGTHWLASFAVYALSVNP